MGFQVFFRCRWLRNPFAITLNAVFGLAKLADNHWA